MPPNLTNTSNPESLLHFYWTGRPPGDKTIHHLRAWQIHLQQNGSEFKVCLWVTADIYEKMKNDQKRPTQENNGSLLLGSPPTQIQIRNIAPLIAEANTYCPQLVEFYQKLVDAKLYSFASSFARTVILNSYPGFYCDMDMQPNPNAHFPKSLETLKQAEPLYNQAPKNHEFGYFNGLFVENQVMLTLEEDIFIERLKKYNAEIEQNPQHPISRANELIKHYFKQFNKLKSQLEDDPNMAKKDKLKHIDAFKNGPHNDLYSELFANITGEEKELLSQGLDLFQFFYRLSIRNFDYQKAIDTSLSTVVTIQENFQNPTQDKKAVYAWSHPIHFRLERLQQTANKIGDFYAKQNAKILDTIQNGNLVYLQKNVHRLNDKILLNALEKAIKTNHWDVIHFLIDRATQQESSFRDPADCETLRKSMYQVIEKAIQSGHLEIVMSCCKNYPQSASFMKEITRATENIVTSVSNEIILPILTVLAERLSPEVFQHMLSSCFFTAVQYSKFDKVALFIPYLKRMEQDKLILKHAHELSMLVYHNQFSLFEQLMPKESINPETLIKLIQAIPSYLPPGDIFRYYLLQNPDQVNSAVINCVIQKRPDIETLTLLFDKFAQHIESSTLLTMLNQTVLTESRDSILYLLQQATKMKIEIPSEFITMLLKNTLETKLNASIETEIIDQYGELDGYDTSPDVSAQSAALTFLDNLCELPVVQKTLQSNENRELFTALKQNISHPEHLNTMKVEPPGLGDEQVTSKYKRQLAESIRPIDTTNSPARNKINS
jgi:hypothetical protein